VTPFLQQFFAAAGAYFGEHPDDPQRLIAAFPGWEVDPRRVGLYGRFVRGNLEDVLEHLFPICKAALDAPRWEGLLRAFYARRPATHWELNAAGRDFPAFLTEQADLPPFLGDLATFEWAKFAVYAAEVEVPTRVETLTVNPTLRLLSHPWRLCRYSVAFGETGEVARGGPVAEEEQALLWRNRRRFTSYRPADARSLLPLKLAAEGIAPEEAARAGGVPVEEVRAAVDEAIAKGFVLAP